MKVYKEEPGKRMTLDDIGLGTAEFTWHFGHPEKMQRAALHLMKCHPHHFAVLPDSNFALATSALGVSCLRKAIAEGKIEP